MPTIDDLRDAFDELERHAPTTLSASSAPGPLSERRTTRRRWAAMGLAAACTAGLAIAVPLAVSQNRPSPQHHAGSSVTPPAHRTAAPVDEPFDAALPAPAAGESPVLAYGFATSGAGASSVKPDRVTRTYQHASITGDTDDSSTNGELFVFYAGDYDPTKAEQGTPVQVGDRQGYYAQLPLPGDAGLVFDALAWQYADGGWAVIAIGDAANEIDFRKVPHGNTQSIDKTLARQRAERRAARAYDQSTELTLAENTHSANDPLLSPVRVPTSSGLFVVSMSTEGGYGDVELTDSSAPDGVIWDLGWDGSTLHPSDKPDTTTTQINGRQWIVYNANSAQFSVGLVANGFGMTVVPDVTSSTKSLAQVEQFAGALTFAADLADPSTWFDARTALP